MLLAANTSQHQEETTGEQQTQHHLVFLVRSGLTLGLWTIPSQLYCRNPTGTPFGQVWCLTNTGPQLTLMAASYIHASLQKKNFVHDLQKHKLKILHSSSSLMGNTKYGCMLNCMQLQPTLNTEPSLCRTRSSL